MSEINKQQAKFIQCLLIDAGINQREFSKMIGVSEATVCYWAQGKTPIRKSNLDKIYSLFPKETDTWNTQLERTCEIEFASKTIGDSDCLGFKCSACKYMQVTPERGLWGASTMWNYCPNCGAKVVKS